VRLGLYAALDPYARLDVFDCSGKPDWRKFALVADSCAFGLTPTRQGLPEEIFLATLEWIKRDVQDRTSGCRRCLLPAARRSTSLGRNEGRPGHRSATSPPRPAASRAPRPGTPRHLIGQSTRKDTMRHRLVAVGITTAALIATVACSSSAPAAPPTRAAAATTTAAASTSSAAAQPETAATATAVAKQYFGLYSAGQFALSWTLLAPSAKRHVSQATWVAVHQGCPSQAAGLAYDIKDTTLTGSTAVVTVTLAGAAASLASESESLTYSDGRWGFVPNDLSYYEHGSVRADIAVAKAAGYCASS
jgi:hypothetical protein